MPALDAYIPDRSLMPEAERTLVGTWTDLLLKHEGVAPPIRPHRRLPEAAQG